jgi:hypothetical protein
VYFSFVFFFLSRSLFSVQTRLNTVDGGLTMLELSYQVRIPTHN